jgi:hypothetical protein
MRFSSTSGNDKEGEEMGGGWGPIVFGTRLEYSGGWTRPLEVPRGQGAVQRLVVVHRTF